MFFPKPVWNALKKHQIIWSATISIVPVLCSAWSVTALPLIQMGFLIFPYMSSASLVTTVDSRKLWTIWQNVKILLWTWKWLWLFTLKCMHTSMAFPALKWRWQFFFWTGNMQTGLTPGFSFSSSFSTWIKSQLLFKIEVKQACELECKRRAKYYFICAFRIC